MRKSPIDWTELSWNPLTGCYNDCFYCLHPDTLILMHDFTNRKLKDINVGDKIVGFDEYLKYSGKHREIKPAIVQSIIHTHKPAFRITTEDGNSVICSKEHIWLTERGWKQTIGSYGAGIKSSEQIKGLTLNNKLHSYGTAYEILPDTEDYRLGYIVGMIMGDGAIGTYDYSGRRKTRKTDKQHSFRLTLKDNDALNYCKTTLEDLGYSPKTYVHGGLNSIRMNDRHSVLRIKETVEGWLSLHSASKITSEMARGFVAGYFDAEGTYNGTIGICNTNLNQLKLVEDYLRMYGIPSRTVPRMINFKHETYKERRKKQYILRIIGGIKNEILFFSIFNPKIKREAGKIYSYKSGIGRGIRIKLIENLNKDIGMIDIQTSVGTFVANGIFTHNCYAKGIAHRFASGNPPCGHDEIITLDDPIREKDDTPVEGIKPIGKVEPYPYGFVPTFHRYKLDEPQKRKKPSRIFVCSMGELFGSWIPDEWIDDVFYACQIAPQHTYLFLTKNPLRYSQLHNHWKLPYEKNHWYGITVTSDGEFFPLCIDAQRNLFISFEPILSDLHKFTNRKYWVLADWLIFGPETQRDGKPVPKPYWKWIKGIVLEAMEEGVPVFMKSKMKEFVPEKYFVQQYPDWSSDV